MERLLQAPRGAYRGFAAVTAGEGDGAGRPPAGRVVVNPATFRKLSSTGALVVFAHEATHVASRQATRAGTPRWLSEGLADYVGYRHSGLSEADITAELRSWLRHHDPPRTLPGDDAFTGDSGRRLPVAYELAWLAVRELARQHGMEQLVRFYRAVGAARPGDVDRVMRRTLGVSLRDFTVRWRAVVRPGP